MSDQRIHHQRQAALDGQAHIVHQAQGRGTGAAVGTVDGKEIRRILKAALVDMQAHFVKPARLAYNRLDTDRLAGDFANPVDHVEQIVDTVNIRVPVGAEGVLAHGDAAGACDHLSHLGARQDAALAGLGALGELDFHHPNFVVAGHCPEPVIAELTLLVTHAVLGGAYLEYQITAALQVVAGDRPLTRVQPDTRQFCTARQRADSGRGQGAEAHRRYIEERGGRVGLSGKALPEADGAARLYFLLQWREQAVEE